MEPRLVRAKIGNGIMRLERLSRIILTRKIPNDGLASGRREEEEEDWGQLEWGYFESAQSIVCEMNLDV